MKHTSRNLIATAICLAVGTFAAPLRNAVNPRYTLTTLQIPLPQCTSGCTTSSTTNQTWNGLPAITGLDFLSDGRMVVVTTSHMHDNAPALAVPGGRVLLVTDPNGPSPQVTEIANTFRHTSGLTVVNDHIYVSDRDYWYEIPSLTPTANLASNKTIIKNWPTPETGFAWSSSGSFWHQWVFSPFYYQGKFYAPYSGSIVSGGPSNTNPTTSYSGAFLQWDLTGGTAMTTLTKVGGGLRSPNGGNVSTDGIMMVADNQGSWLSSATLTHVKPGKFYGHRQGNSSNGGTGSGVANWAETMPYQPPAAWYIFTDPQTNVNTIWGVRQSPSQPLYLANGPYMGDWLQGDIDGDGLLRVSMDSVKDTTGEWQLQGCVTWFSRGFGTYPAGEGSATGGDTAADAINRMTLRPNGDIFIGSFRSAAGNWAGGVGKPIRRLSLKPDTSAFELKRINSLKDGFELVFSEPIDPATALTSPIVVKQMSIIRNAAYGGGNGSYVTKTVSSAAVSNDGRRVYVKVDGLQRFNDNGARNGGSVVVSGQNPTHYVTKFTIPSTLKPARSNKDSVWNNEAWYTLNWISDRTWTPTAATGVRPASEKSSLGDRVWHTIQPGLLHVNVSLAGSYTAVLHDLAGRTVAKRTGRDGEALDFKSPAATQSLYLLEVTAPDGRYAKLVSF